MTVDLAKEHERRLTGLRLSLAQAALPASEAFECPYLPEREARQVVVATGRLRPGAYHLLMDLNFRRMGPVYYRPACEGCAACQALRVPVERFAPDRSQRRCWRVNADLAARVSAPEADDERLALYRRYLSARHGDGRMEGSWDELVSLYHPAPGALEVSFRLDGRLIAAGVFDAEPRALSAVYCYFDPAEVRRGLGVFNVLWLIEECRQRGVPYLYLGYHVAASPKMAYKARYQPCELLAADGHWVPSTAEPE
jgi:arginine-tRNA-protein transferase